MIDAREFVAGDAERLIVEWGRIALIPAPEGAESDRAALIAELARAAGADHVELDRVGNVVTWLDGDRPDGETLTFLGTFDDLGSVAAERSRTDRLYRDGDRLVGPCVEVGSSVASALSIIRFARAARPWRRLLVVFVLGEETGLTGVRALVEDHGAGLGSVIDLMGGVGTVSWNAIGFAGVEIEFVTAPRHSLFGGCSEVTDAIGRFITAVHAHVPASDDERVTIRRINRVHAGTVFNHSPSTGAVSVDVRSTDPDVLAALHVDTRTLAEAAAQAAGVEVRLSDGQRGAAVTLPGGREHRLVQALAEGIRFTGREPWLRPYSSSNINVVYAAGLEGIVHDGTHRGAGRGTPDEWADIPGVLDGVAADCRMLQLVTEA